jgi:hypothetical protein
VALRCRSIEASRLFYFAGFLKGCDFGEQALAAQASFVPGGHRNVRQFRAPAARFLLAGHRGAALNTDFFHQLMMAQL